MQKELPTFRRGNFFTGLMATPVFWNDIQDYHFSKESFYNAVFHGEGIIPGVLDELKVSSVKKGGNLTVVIGAGAAIDRMGRGLFLKDPQAKIIDIKKYKLPTTIYIVLNYSETLEDYYQSKENPEFQGYQKKNETATVEITTKAPSETNGLEVARIYLEEDDNGEIKEITEPDDITRPKANELDTRYVLWTQSARRGTSPHLRKYLTEVLDDTRSIAAIANDVVSLPGLRELQTVALTAKMLIQLGNVAYDDIVNVFYPIYDINNHVIQEMLDYERDTEKRIFSTKEHFNHLRTAVYDMGELIKYYDYKLETIDKVLKLQEDVLNSIRNIIVTKKVTFDDISLISYDLPRILVIDDERYTLVEYLDFNDYETEESHNFAANDTKDYTTTKQSFFYPDGEKVKDTVKRFSGGTLSFTIRNLVKKRELLMVRRTDIFHGNYKVDVTINEEFTSQLVIDGYDSKNRWRNIYMLVDEDVIDGTSAEVKFNMGTSGRDCFGKIWFYQKL